MKVCVCEVQVMLPYMEGIGFVKVHVMLPYMEGIGSFKLVKYTLPNMEVIIVILDNN